MSRFPAIHVSDIPEFKRLLRRQGYKPEEKAQDEILRFRHPETKVVIIIWGKTSRANPFPRVNPNGYKIWEEFENNRSKEGS